MLVRAIITVLICAVCLVSIAFTRGSRTPVPDIQSIATEALGEREGTIIVVDPQTGQIKTVVNPAMAYERAFPPGSTIKPFTALAALRAGVIDENSRIRCREEPKEEIPSCSHPRELPPLNPAEALAYSCNYYFAKTGERITADQLGEVLTEFGFSQVNRAKWKTDSAIGEGEFVQVTPIQLLLAYTALVNGGRLFNPSSGPAQVSISDDERAILLAGMRGAVKFGTAEKAGLASLPNYVVGKTGTSTPLRGFRSQGWFVGISFAPNKPPEPQNAQLAVLVYLTRGHGSEAAEIAAPIFRRSVSESVSIRVPSVPSITVTVQGRVLSLEDYVARVVFVEGSTEDQPESLKALAVAVRTFALKNLGRHKDEGYDFCTTTHCQRFEAVDPPAAIIKAVNETAGLILQDDRGLIADSYFGASCGGMTANIQTLWGTPAPKYLTGVRDDYCNAGFHRQWTDVIAPDRLATALRSDPRTNVGETIRELTVAKRDQTGRAELVSILGKDRRVINGWEFKLIVGRALGWNVLKSSRFTISRSGSAFVFRGSGFGHGLGLCQEGSHEMGQRGYNFRQILAKYFPGTTVAPQAVWISKRSSHFKVSSQQQVDAKELDRILSLLEGNRAALLNRLSSAGIEFRFPDVEIIVNKTTGDFVGRTGQPAWAAAATRNNQIELQPLALLKRRAILETTLRHELVHVVIDAIGGRQTPRWFAEGIALYVAGEGKMFERYGKSPAISSEELEQKLASARSNEEMKSAYAAAYNMVRELVRLEGEKKLWQRVAQHSYDVRAIGVSAAR